MKKILILSMLILFLLTPKASFAAENQNPGLFWQKMSLFFTFSPEKKVQKILEFSENDLISYDLEIDSFEKLAIKKRVENRVFGLGKHLNKLDEDFRLLVEDKVVEIENSFSPEESDVVEEMINEGENNTNTNTNTNTNIEITPTVNKKPVVTQSATTPIVVEEVSISDSGPTREQKIAQEKILKYQEDYQEIQDQIDDIKSEVEDLNDEYTTNKADLNQRILNRQQQYLNDMNPQNMIGMSIGQRNAREASITNEYEYDIFELELEGQQLDLDYQSAYQTLSSEFNSLNSELQDVALKIQQQQLILN